MCVLNVGANGPYVILHSSVGHGHGARKLLNIINKLYHLHYNINDLSVHFAYISKTYNILLNLTYFP